MGRVYDQVYRAFLSFCMALITLVISTLASATELSGGMSVGGFQVGTIPSLALSPHFGASWHVKHNLVFAFHNLCSLLPPLGGAELGVFNKTSMAIGYAMEKATFSIGPAFSFYYIPACGLNLCGRVVGVAPGANAQTEMYIAGPLGISMNANVHWVGGRSLVLPGGVAVMIVAGPVFRWRVQ